MNTNNSNINFHINEMHAEWEIVPADFKAMTLDYLDLMSLLSGDGL